MIYKPFKVKLSFCLETGEGVGDTSFEVDFSEPVSTSFLINYLRFQTRTDNMGLYLFMKEQVRDEYDRICLDLRIVIVNPSMLEEMEMVESVVAETIKTAQWIESYLAQYSFTELIEHIVNETDSDAVKQSIGLNSTETIDLFEFTVVLDSTLNDFSIRTLTEVGVEFLKELSEKRKIELNLVEFSVGYQQTSSLHCYSLQLLVQADEKTKVALFKFYDQYFDAFAERLQTTA